MKLITPQTIQAVYEMLVQLPPFNRWNLPPSKHIIFEAINDPTCYGEYEPEPHAIRISYAKIGHLENLTKTMAHEMIHLKLYIKGSKSWDNHDKVFCALSHKVAVQLGYDPKEL
jgi:hypothetical protein